MKPHWNVWHVRNRWLRAAVVWAVAVPLIVWIVLVAVGATILFAIVGAAKEIWTQLADGLSGLRGPDNGRMWRNAWRAMTLRDPS